MSENILNLLGDIKAGRPVGMVKHQPTNPRNFQMYGRTDGVTIGQHLDEFDSFNEEEGRTFDEAIMDGLFSDDKALMPPPPKPHTSKKGKSETNKVDVRDYMARLENHHIVQATKRLVEKPAYKAKMEEQALKGATKRKLGQESSDLQAQNARVLNSEHGETPTTFSAMTGDGVRKRPMQRRPNV
ncbi:hypothetical protein CC86DRAFT_457692 [Ophiobolus disseminans]|uniref:Uncharacterized protein n=1 Tax=Ophiobolus disseminans TaxID=1469910 RepID=A0A6A6ZSI5_9PLEO|nr:hypothetical protein CC86DRAFT_457692 [Ophiobolus disseminans]